MNMAYFPGCSLTGTAREYDESLRAVLRLLDVHLEEIPDWSCCGASSAHATDHLLAVALPARTLALCTARGHDRLLAPCAACYNRLVMAREHVLREPGLREQLSTVLGIDCDVSPTVINIVQLLQELGTEAISARRKHGASSTPLACYYGCLLLRPADQLRFDDPEQPHSMEDMLSGLGFTTVDWNFRTECCGAAHSIARTDIVLDLSARIIDNARAHGAKAIIVACPMCHSNLDMRQRDMRTASSDPPPMPILYLTELIGLALGLAPEVLGLHRHFVSTGPLCQSLFSEEVPA